MIKELWSSFPRLLEHKINALLDEAEPSSIKAFQLYKTCHRENLWQESFEKFSEKLGQFFALPRNERTKSGFDKYLDRPMSVAVFEGFQLHFGNALINNKSLLEIVNWAHNLIRVGYKTNSIVISIDVLTKTLQHITNPAPFEKVQNIEFEDFCIAWKKIVFKLFGKKYDAELTPILNELRLIQTQLKADEDNFLQDSPFVPLIYLTQTEIDWTISVKKAVEENSTIPKFPLSRGPQKQRLIELSRTISLYKIVQTSRLMEFVKHRESIRVTILDQCNRLLKEKAR
ncbi:MAG: hypothetical protein ACXVCY_06530 [Pseudobdellovibrionaceae bacterium]